MLMLWFLWAYFEGVTGQEDGREGGIWLVLAELVNMAAIKACVKFDTSFDICYFCQLSYIHHWSIYSPLEHCYCFIIAIVAPMTNHWRRSYTLSLVSI